jgi:hypothetical protein
MPVKLLTQRRRGAEGKGYLVADAERWATSNCDLRYSKLEVFFSAVARWICRGNSRIAREEYFRITTGDDLYDSYM